MFSDSVEVLKSQYTDKYVKVDARRPELARFRDVVGQVKTVNMNGRALVEFLDYHLNTGWFDIDLSCLTVVDKPAPSEAKEKKAEPKPAAAKPAAAKAAPATGEKKLSPLEMARMQGTGARGGGAVATAKPASAAPAAGKKSTADILAAARGGKPAAQAAAAPAPAAPKAEPPAAPAPTPPTPAPAPTPVAEAPAAMASGVVKVDRNSMSVDDKIAYCRAKDGK